MEIVVRDATLDDTAGITALHTAQVEVWQRIDHAGHVETVSYADLTVDERWLHGRTVGSTPFGAWMSVETGAILLNHLLLGAGMPLVAVEQHEGANRVVGYAEAYIGAEPEPFGAHLYLNELLAKSAAHISALLEALAARAKAGKYRHVLTARTGDDLPEAVEAAARPLACLRRFTIPARQGQVFYRAVESPDADPKRIAGWSMPVGRYTSARAQWEALWAHLWDTLPHTRARKRHRLQLNAGGLEALVCVQQGMYDPRAAEVFVWAPKMLTPQVVAALRDWGHREGYRALTFAIEEESAAILGAEAEGDGYHLDTCALVLGGG